MLRLIQTQLGIENYFISTVNHYFLRGPSGLKVDFFLFHFSNVRPLRKTYLKGFVVIRKILEVIGIWVVFSKRWDLYLQELLSDSTETFLFWRMCFWLGGSGLEKIIKNWKFIIFEGVEKTKNTGKSDFKHEVSLFSKKKVIFVIFLVPPSLVRRIIFKIKRFQSNRIITFGDTGPTDLDQFFDALTLTNDSPGPPAMINDKTKNIFL